MSERWGRVKRGGFQGKSGALRVKSSLFPLFVPTLFPNTNLSPLNAPDERMTRKSRLYINL